MNGGSQSSRVVIITGGSRGIGRATALAAAKRGWRVVIGYATNKVAADDVVAKIEASNGKALAVKCDVGVEADILALFKAADSLGPLGGSFLCAREAVKRMSTKHGGKGGVVVNLSSVAATLGSANTYVDYAASKGAVDTFTLGLSNEVAAEGIRVAGIRPGLIDTEIHASGGDPDRHHRLSKTVPMQRVGTADEIANAIVWLMSDEASYVTGTTLNVSGGR
jgi:NAD(P)-dependent dehydrogenase (short-subunit alcohol dehydrogenase family)